MKVRKLKKLQQRKVFYGITYCGCGLFVFRLRYGQHHFGGPFSLAGKHPSARTGLKWAYT